MIGQFTIAKSRPAKIGLDQQQLYAIGLDHVRGLARNVWTDHNLHDPGITTLELLTYALTDLTQRASLPIEDLLVGCDFFTARSLLPNRPWTMTDYRKVMIDVDGVKNAWLLPAELTYFADAATGEILQKDPNRSTVKEIKVGGLYQARIEYSDDTQTPADQAKVDAAVLAQLQAHRALCEDFLDVKAIERQKFLLCGEVELSPDADTSSVHAQILQGVGDYLSPGVTCRSLAAMLERRSDGTARSVADIFEGPALQHGFIDTAELDATNLRDSLRLSDVISIVMDIEGVLAVRDMIISPEQPKGAEVPPDNRWVVPVEEGKAATLDVDRSRLVYYKRNMPIVPGAGPASPPAQPEAPGPLDIPVPTGRQRNADTYYSFQHHFPATYGVGDTPLSETVGTRRLALVSQLKAYLLFFDQVMANYCKQLAEIRQLFSTDPKIRDTYFSQVVTQLPDYAKIYTSGEADATAIAGQIGPLIEDETERVERRNRFLDHLIARFAERFHDYALIMRSAFGSTDAVLIADKCAFLKDYPAISGDRGLAYNYTLAGAQDLWNSSNISGLERRLHRLLGIADATRRDLTDVSLGADATVTGNAANQFGFTFVDSDTRNVLFKESKRFATDDLARQQLLRALELGQWNSTYVRGTRPGQQLFFSIVAPGGEIVAESGDFENDEAVQTAIVELRTYLRQRYSREGFHLVENLLLRPTQDGDSALHFCADPNCVDCGSDDPYSYRVHVVLPAYAGRFNHMDFRRFVEGVIREEMPAHILPKICWINEDDMKRFEKAYRDWLDVQSGVDTAHRADRMKALVEVLTTIKSVYPVQKLTPCDSPETQPRFILGRSALGSKADND